LQCGGLSEGSAFLNPHFATPVVNDEPVTCTELVFLVLPLDDAGECLVHVVEELLSLRLRHTRLLSQGFRADPITPTVAGYLRFLPVRLSFRVVEVGAHNVLAPGCPRIHQLAVSSRLEPLRVLLIATEGC